MDKKRTGKKTNKFWPKKTNISTKNVHETQRDSVSKL